MNLELKMILLYLYDEFGPGMGLPSMKDSFWPTAYPGQTEIVEYLKAGKVHMACPGFDYDKFTGDQISTEKTYMDDGVYVWPSSLPYYVERYNLRLSEEFERHVRERMSA